MVVLIDIAALAVWLVWLFISLLMRLGKHLDRQVPGWANTVWAVLKWPALVSTGVMFICNVLEDPDGVGRFFTLALQVANWWWYRNEGDDDDFWRKTKRRLTEKVAEIDGRLSVVPNNA